MLQVLLYSVLAILRLNTFIALLFHQISGCVVSVSVAVSDEFTAIGLDFFEEVRAVRNLVWNNLECFEVSQNVFDKLKFLGKWVGVVKT